MGKFSDEFVMQFRGREKIWCEKHKFKIPKYFCKRFSCEKWVGNGGICFSE